MILLKLSPNALHELRRALEVFVASLTSQPLVQAVLGGGHISFTRDLLVSTVVAAVVATVRQLVPAKP